MARDFDLRGKVKGGYISVFKAGSVTGSPMLFSEIKFLNPNNPLHKSDLLGSDSLGPLDQDFQGFLGPPEIHLASLKSHQQIQSLRLAST